MTLVSTNEINLEALTQELKSFLWDAPLTVDEEETIFTRTGETISRTIKRPNTPPMLSRFARDKNLTLDTLSLLAEGYPPLREVLDSWADIVKEFTIHHGLLGNYDSTFSKFFLTNTTDMKDSKQVDVRKLNIHAKIKELEAEGDPLIQVLKEDPSTTQIPDVPEARRVAKAFELPAPPTRQ